MKYEFNKQSLFLVDGYIIFMIDIDYMIIIWLEILYFCEFYFISEIEKYSIIINPRESFDEMKKVLV